MATDARDDAPTPARAVTLRLKDEEVSALEYLQQLFAEKYDGVSSVLRDYSVNQAVETHRRALAMAGSA